MKKLKLQNFVLPMVIVSSSFLFAVLSTTPFQVAAVTDSGGASAPSLSGSLGEDASTKEKTLPPCEILKWSDPSGGGGSCVAESSSCENTSGGGMCIATNIQAVLNKGYVIDVIPGEGEPYSVTKETNFDISLGGFPEDVFTGLITTKVDPVNGWSSGLFSSTPIAEQSPEFVWGGFDVYTDTINKNLGLSADLFSPELATEGGVFPELKSDFKAQLVDYFVGGEVFDSYDPQTGGSDVPATYTGFFGDVTLPGTPKMEDNDTSEYGKQWSKDLLFKGAPNPFAYLFERPQKTQEPISIPVLEDLMKTQALEDVAKQASKLSTIDPIGVFPSYDEFLEGITEITRQVPVVGSFTDIMFGESGIKEDRVRVASTEEDPFGYLLNQDLDSALGDIPFSPQGAADPSWIFGTARVVEKALDNVPPIVIPGAIDPIGVFPSYDEFLEGITEITRQVPVVGDVVENILPTVPNAGLGSNAAYQRATEFSGYAREYGCMFSPAACEELGTLVVAQLAFENTQFNNDCNNSSCGPGQYQKATWDEQFTSTLKDINGIINNSNSTVSEKKAANDLLTHINSQKGKDLRFDPRVVSAVMTSHKSDLYGEFVSVSEQYGVSVEAVAQLEHFGSGHYNNLKNSPENIISSNTGYIKGNKIQCGGPCSELAVLRYLDDKYKNDPRKDTLLIAGILTSDTTIAPTGTGVGVGDTGSGVLGIPPQANGYLAGDFQLGNTALDMIDTAIGSGVPAGGFVTNIVSGMVDLASGNATEEQVAQQIFGPQIDAMRKIQSEGLNAGTLPAMFGVVTGMLGNIVPSVGGTNLGQVGLNLLQQTDFPIAIGPPIQTSTVNISPGGISIDGIDASIKSTDQAGVTYYDHGLTKALVTTEQAALLKKAGVPHTVRGYDIVILKSPEGFSQEEDRALTIASQLGLDRKNPNEVAGALLLFDAAKTESLQTGINAEILYETNLKRIRSAGQGANVLNRLVADLATGQSTVKASVIAASLGGVGPNLTDFIRRETVGTPEDVVAQIAKKKQEVESMLQPQEIQFYNLTAGEQKQYLNVSDTQYQKIQDIQTKGITVTVPARAASALISSAPAAKSFEAQYGPYGYFYQEDIQEKSMAEIIADWGLERVNQVIERVAPSGDVLVNPITGSMDLGSTPEFGYARGRLHAGVDLYGLDPTNLSGVDNPVVSVIDGIVVRAQVQSGYGFTVDIKGVDGNVYRYAHVADTGIKYGDRVTQGQTISYVTGSGTNFGDTAKAKFGGDTAAAEQYFNKNGWGSTAKPHLHFEVRTAEDAFYGKDVKNPLSLFPDLNSGSEFVAGQIANKGLVNDDANANLHTLLTATRAEVYGGATTRPSAVSSGSFSPQARVPTQGQPSGNGPTSPSIGDTIGGAINTVANNVVGGIFGGSSNVDYAGTVSGLFGQGSGKGGAAPQEIQAPDISCSPNSVVNEMNRPVTVTWKCYDGGQSSGIGFVTNGAPEGQVIIESPTTNEPYLSYGIQCGNGMVNTCPVRVLHPDVALILYPSSVAVGGSVRATWAAADVDSCIVYGPSGGQVAQGAADGTIAGITIHEDSYIQIMCTTVTGEQVYDEKFVSIAN